ncbi:MAG: hypothetical protein ACOC56_06620 [Atribacterota bacterium]
MSCIHCGLKATKKYKGLLLCDRCFRHEQMLDTKNWKKKKEKDVIKK